MKSMNRVRSGNYGNPMPELVHSADQSVAEAIKRALAEFDHIDPMPDFPEARQPGTTVNCHFIAICSNPSGGSLATPHLECRWLANHEATASAKRARAAESKNKETRSQ